jgi:hypothetical protein
MAEYKLTWKVARNEDGSFVRRRIDGDNLGLDYIDVEWSHRDGFPSEYEIHPVSHPPHIRYQKRELPARKVLQDQVSLPQGTPDSTVVMILDEKRKTLARALGVAE